MKRLTNDQTYCLYTAVKTNPELVTGAKTWAEAAKRVGDAVGFRISPSTMSNAATGDELNVRPTPAHETPVAKMWQHIRTLEAKLTATEAEVAALKAHH